MDKTTIINYWKAWIHENINRRWAFILGIVGICAIYLGISSFNAQRAYENDIVYVKGVVVSNKKETNGTFLPRIGFNDQAGRVIFINAPRSYDRPVPIHSVVQLHYISGTPYSATIDPISSNTGSVIAYFLIGLLFFLMGFTRLFLRRPTEGESKNQPKQQQKASTPSSEPDTTNSVIKNVKPAKQSQPTKTQTKTKAQSQAKSAAQTQKATTVKSKSQKMPLNKTQAEPIEPEQAPKVTEASATQAKQQSKESATTEPPQTEPKATKNSTTKANPALAKLRARKRS